jgi:hypothetical protein
MGSSEEEAFDSADDEGDDAVMVGGREARGWEEPRTAGGDEDEDGDVDSEKEEVIGRQRWRVGDARERDGGGGGGGDSDGGDGDGCVASTSECDVEGGDENVDDNKGMSIEVTGRSGGGGGSSGVVLVKARETVDARANDEVRGAEEAKSRPTSFTPPNRVATYGSDKGRGSEGRGNANHGGGSGGGGGGSGGGYHNHGGGDSGGGANTSDGDQPLTLNPKP